jgi:possible N-acetylmuramoyl-L-alanine amidase|nr:MAG TPA: N-acetylmuramoyl-L-alanine amidase [Caudoviricetes sp.]
MTNAAVTDVQWSPNYSSGRPFGDVDSITIHHWGVDGQSHQNVVNYLCRDDGDSSAHYVASAGRVTQLVHDYDRAWHAGPGGNPRSIGIECRPEMTDGDVATVIGLIQAIRAEHGPLPIVGHRDWMSTDCPGRWYSHLSELSDGSGFGAVSSPAPVVDVNPYTGKWNKSDGQGELRCTGVFGMATIGRLQQVMGTTIDGVLDEDGSPAVERFQAFLNSVVPADTQIALNGTPALETDGILGPNTWRTFQYLVIAWHKEYLPAGWDFADWVDGEAGTATIGALQRALNNSKSGTGKLW